MLMRTSMLALVILIAGIVFSVSAENPTFPEVPELSKFEVHMTCLPKDATGLSTKADIYQLFQSGDVDMQLFVYIIKFESLGYELRSEVVISKFGEMRRGFLKNSNESEWRSISAERHNGVFTEGIKKYMDDGGRFDQKRFPCQKAQKT